MACQYFSLIANRWLSIRLELTGNLFILSTAMLAIIAKNWGIVTGGLIGLSISKSLDVSLFLLIKNKILFLDYWSFKFFNSSN